MFDELLQEYGIDVEPVDIIPYGSGLINETWIIKTEIKNYILQRINEKVFKKPADIAGNISSISQFLEKQRIAYLFVAPLPTNKGETMVHFNLNGYFRLFDFIEKSHSIDVATDPAQAYEAAKQFGQFTKLLSDFDAHRLTPTIPHFHDLPLRYDQFEQAVLHGDAERLKQSAIIIAYLKKQRWIVDRYKELLEDPSFKVRVTHHDTKISNVLFDDAMKGLCVIDLDTVMPGYFISDVGDMVRTYLSPANEEEKDFAKIEIRPEYFRAIVNGYLGEMKDKLTTLEKGLFIFAGQYMIYMQALRFITDHLNGDIYYGSKYEDQNYVRAGNQVVLLQDLKRHELGLQSILDKELLKTSLY